jgi:methoxymalonate biosynthesis acyl carrier protein
MRLDTMGRDEIKARIRTFVQRFIRGRELADGEDIFATGFVNSMFAMQLVQFVETEFSVAVEDADLEMDNFRSIDALTALVERKTAGAGAA